MGDYTVHRGYFEPFRVALMRGFAFILVIGTTDTSLIPGITVAGASPELTHYTPPADAEYLLLGGCRVVPTVPMTPDGKPTPALITRAALQLSRPLTLVVNAGSRIRPNIPYVDVGGEPGGDIRSGKALPREVVGRIIDRGLLLGRELASAFSALVIGESIPAGTTTAMAFLVAMGYNAWNRMSSSSPVNPRDLKVKVVREALEKAGIKDALSDPIDAVSRVGDPVIPAMASIAIGAIESGAKVILAGGTQMAAVSAFMKAIDKKYLRDVSIATTRWLVSDKSADLLGLMAEVDPQVPIVSASLDFSSMPYPGLRAYEEGFVKEGVGAGGSVVATLVRGFTLTKIVERIVSNYEELLKRRT